MDKSIVDLAVTIKETIKGNKPKLDNFVVGKVVSLSPLTISIDEAIMAYHDQIYALASVFSEQDDNLKFGDEVALLPSTNYQQFLLLGRVVSL